MKAKYAKDVLRFQDIPNVGPRVENDFKKLGIKQPKDLAKKNPLTLYNKLCAITKSRHDPCVLDVFMAVVYFMDGSSTKPWWFYTEERKRKFPKI
jgi:hypothetical protein